MSHIGILVYNVQVCDATVVRQIMSNYWSDVTATAIQSVSQEISYHSVEFSLNEVNSIL